MKRISFYVMLALLGSVIIVACRKEKVLVLGDQHVKSGETGESGDPFHVWCASLDEGKLIVEVFHGGNEAQEFSFSWDGQITNPFPDSCNSCRQVEIRIIRAGTNQDTDSLSFSQTVSFNLSDLNISTEDLNNGTLLKIMNASDENNFISLYAPEGKARGGECTWTTRTPSGLLLPT